MRILNMVLRIFKRKLKKIRVIDEMEFTYVSKVVGIPFGRYVKKDHYEWRLLHV